MNKNIKIADGSEQNVVIDKNGVLCREYLPYEEEYDKRQLKIVSRGLYITDDDWENVRAGIGDFTYYDPETGETKQGYGVIANVLIAPLILSEDVGVYNEEGTVKLDKNGLTIVNTGSGDNDTVFRVQKQSSDESQVVDVIYFDSEGNAHFNGKISASALYGGILKLGGEDNMNGTLQIVDANGTVIGTWDNTGITVNSGTITASAIKGGTLTLGGANNVNGALQIVNASGTTIGTWNKDGITVNAGSIVANAIKGGTLTLGGTSNVNGQMAMLDASGNTYGSWNNDGLYIGRADNHVKLQAAVSHDGGTSTVAFYAKSLADAGVYTEVFVDDGELIVRNTQSDYEVRVNSGRINIAGNNNELTVGPEYIEASYGNSGASEPFRFDVAPAVLNFVANGLSINGTAGASGTFTTANGKTVTVTNGLITQIV